MSLDFLVEIGVWVVIAYFGFALLAGLFVLVFCAYVLKSINKKDSDKIEL